MDESTSVTFKIDNRIASEIPPLSYVEFSLLEQSIISDGCMSPLIVGRIGLEPGKTNGGTCKDESCSYGKERRFVPYKYWTPGDGIWECPECGYGIAAFEYENFLLDGHNRFNICEKHGIAYEVKVFDFACFEDALDWVYQNQLGRRNLNPDQFKLLLGRMYNRQKKQGERSDLTYPQIEEKSDTRTSARLAEDYGVSRATVERAGQVVQALEQHPDIYEKVKSGDLSLYQAKKEIVAATIPDKPELKTESKYRVIYADPPWRYGNTMPDYAPDQEHHYPTMSFSEIMALPVRDITEENAVLFLWVTSPILEESFDVIKAWGFEYKSSFVWDKIKHNMGHYNSVRHELLLVCVRGSCQPDIRKLFDSVVSIERTTHSKKPEFFREIIDTIYPVGKRIELFAKEKTENWDVYGNQVS